MSFTVGSTVTELTDFSSVQLLTKRLLCYTPNSMVLCTSFTDFSSVQLLTMGFTVTELTDFCSVQLLTERLLCYTPNSHLQWVSLTDFCSVQLLTERLLCYTPKEGKWQVNQSFTLGSTANGVIYSGFHCYRAYRL